MPNGWIRVETVAYLAAFALAINAVVLAFVAAAVIMLLARPAC